MKIVRKIYYALLLIGVMVFMNSNDAFAASVMNQEGIIVETHFDKKEYSKDDEIIYSVYLKNTNSELIHIKDTVLNIPKGFSLKNKDNISLDKLEAGQDILIKYYLQESVEDNKFPEENSGDSGSHQGEANPGDSDSNQGAENLGDSNSNQGAENPGDLDSNQGAESLENGKENTSNQNNSVKTGDSNQILVWICILIIAVLIVFIIIKHQKKSKKILSILLAGLILLENIINPIDVQAKESEKKIEFSETFYFEKNAKELSFRMIIEKENGKIDDNTSYSRAEWIHEIISAYGLKIDLSKASTTHYTDIDSNEYKDDIRIAEIYGVTEKNEQFFPNDVATREFAAMTAVRLLNLQGNGVPNSSDIGEVVYQKEIYLGLKTGLILLEDGKVNPNKPINKTSGDIIIKKIQDYRNIPIIKENTKKYKYKKGTVVLEKSVVLNEDSEYIYLKKTDVSKVVKKGSIFVIDDIKSYKVKNIYDENSSLKIQYSKPELDEYLETVFVSGHYKELDLNKITLAEGVSISELSNKSNTDNQDMKGKDVEHNIPGFRFEKKISNGAATVAVEIPYILVEILYDFDKSANRTKEAYIGVGIEPEISLEPRIKEIDLDEKPNNNEGKNPNGGKEQKPGSNEEQNLNNLNRKVELNNILNFAENYVNNKYLGIEVKKTYDLFTYVIEPGVTFEIDLNLNGNGTPKVVWSIQTKAGIRIIDNVMSPQFESNSDFLLAGSFEASAGLEFSLNAGIINDKSLVSIGIEPGLKFAGKGKVHNSQPILCTDLGAYLTAKIGLFDCYMEDVLKEWYHIVETTKDIFDFENSPFRIEGHFEIGEGKLEVVKVCSHKKYLANIFGYIRDNEDEQIAIANAEIKIYKKDETNFDSNGNILYKTTADEKGYFSMDIDAGSYVALISADNYYNRTERIIVGPGKQERNFFLRRDVGAGVCKIGDKVYSSIVEALDDSKNGDTILVLKDTTEPRQLVIPENKEIVIMSEEPVKISRKEATTDSMILNNGSLILMGPMTFEFQGLTLLNNNSKLEVSGGVTFLDYMSTCIVIRNKGEILLSKRYGNANIEYQCSVQGGGGSLNTGIWNSGIIRSNDAPLFIKDMDYGIVFESKGTIDLGGNYKYVNVQIPAYKWN